MSFMQHRGPETQMAGSLAPFALAAEEFSLMSLLSAALASLEIARQFHATEVQFEILLKFQILRVTAVAAGWVAL